MCDQLCHGFITPSPLYLLDPSRRINVQVLPLRRSVTDPAMNAGIMVIGQPQIAALDRTEQVCWPCRKWSPNFPNFLSFTNTSLLDPQYLPMCVRFTLWPWKPDISGCSSQLGACWLTTFPSYNMYISIWFPFQLARKCPRRSWTRPAAWCEQKLAATWRNDLWIRRWWDLLKFMGYNQKIMGIHGNLWDMMRIHGNP